MTREERAAYNRKWRKTPKGIEYRHRATAKRNASWKGIVATHSKGQHKYIDGIRLDQFGKWAEAPVCGHKHNGIWKHL